MEACAAENCDEASTQGRSVTRGLSNGKLGWSSRWNYYWNGTPDVPAYLHTVAEDGCDTNGNCGLAVASKIEYRDWDTMGFRQDYTTSADRGFTNWHTSAEGWPCHCVFNSTMTGSNPTVEFDAEIRGWFDDPYHDYKLGEDYDYVIDQFWGAAGTPSPDCYTRTQLVYTDAYGGVYGYGNVASGSFPYMEPEKGGFRICMVPVSSEGTTDTGASSPPAIDPGQVSHQMFRPGFSYTVTPS